MVDRIDPNYVYLFLYGEEPEIPYDANHPAEAEAAKRLRKKKQQEFGTFLHGSGKVLFDKWAKRLRTMNIALLTDKKYLAKGDGSCSCNACIAIREMRNLLELCTEAEIHLRTSKL